VVLWCGRYLCGLGVKRPLQVDRDDLPKVWAHTRIDAPGGVTPPIDALGGGPRSGMG
jgi:hypothetical protein